MKTVILTLFSVILFSSSKEPVLSDAELEEMMKDPKYADLLKEAESMGVLPNKKPKQAEEKDKLVDTSNSFSVKPTVSHKIIPKSAPPEPIKHSVQPKKEFDFLSKEEARYLIEVLKQPVFFNTLPAEAKKIVSSVSDDFTFKSKDNAKLLEDLNTSLVNSPNSTAFIDPEGKIGRKGSLTLIDPSTGQSQFVWAVSNSKVLCFYKSQSFLTVSRLIRNSDLVVTDVTATPCLTVSSKANKALGALLVCTVSTQDKELWISTILSNKGQ